MIGVVLMTYGAPSGREDLPRYLARVRGGREPTQELVAEFTSRYERIGWSPLVRVTAAQAAALQRELARRGHDARAAAGMRFSEPSITRAVADLAGAGCGRVLGICMSPQWSPLLMDGYARALEDAAARLAPPLRWAIAGPWYREPAFLDALAERASASLAALPPDAPVIFTAHSLPRRIFEAEPAYVAQLRETGELLAERLRLGPERWRWAYQSAGHTQEEWLRPDLKEVFPDLAGAGHRDVLVVPVQFVADHLEVLYDLDVAAAAEAAQAGLRYRRSEMPNAQPAFVGALAALVERETAAVAS